MIGSPTTAQAAARARRQARTWRSVIAAVTFLSVLAVAEPAWAWPMCGCG